MPSAGRCEFWNVASRAENLVLQALSPKTKAFSISYSTQAQRRCC